jgi:putative copper resistance protein D
MIEALVVSRWIHFASVFALFGASFFWFYIGPRAAQLLPRSFRKTILLLRIAAPLAALSGVAWLAGIIANMTGGFGSVVNPATLQLFFFQTQFGPVAIVRLALFAALVVIALLPRHDRTWLAAILVTAALLLLSQAWFGHAAEGGASPFGALMIAVYYLHMLAAAAWVGGLAPLLFALLEQRGLDPDQTRRVSLNILSRYSLMGMVAVPLIIMTGMANTAFHAVSLSKLLHSTYGDVLLIKLSLVAGMLALAYVNRFVAMPRLRTVPLTETAEIFRLRRRVGFELILGVLVIGIAAVLGITPPPQ